MGQKRQKQSQIAGAMQSPPEHFAIVAQALLPQSSEREAHSD
jgi:hypothetical protein